MRTVYAIVNEENRISRSQVFTKRETAEFARGGMELFKRAGDEHEFYVMRLDIVEGDEEDFLATGGLGPKAGKVVS